MNLRRLNNISAFQWFLDLSWFKKWLLCLSVGIVLIPPVHVAGKNIFAAEWMLAPILVLFTKQIFEAKISKPPRELVFIWVGFFLALFAGRFRGDLAYEFSQYKTYVKVDELRFNWLQEIIRCLRWAIIFSMPWILCQIEIHKKEVWHFFLKALRISVLISAFLAILDYTRITHLGGFYGTDGGSNIWIGRSYGTFQSPLEASLIYAAVLAQNLCSLIDKKRKITRFEILETIILFSALLMTRGLTALVACSVALLSRVIRLPSRIRQYLILAMGLVFLAFLVFDSGGILLMNKINNFSVRLETLFSWLLAIPSHPHILFFGLGFSNLVIDNSFMITLISGGLCLFVPWLFWTKKIFKSIPKEMLPFFIVWIVSWVTLDSMGYWGIGRAAWIFLGLFYRNEASHH